MRFKSLFVLLFLLAVELPGAEKVFDFSSLKAGELPAGWRAALTGGGPPPKWELVLAEAPTELPRFSDTPGAINRRLVMAQTSTDTTDERFPLLIHDEEDFGDFKLTTRFKTISGQVEQMAGIAFRIVDEKNYHVVRASSKGGTFLFYSFIDGQRTQPVGVNIPIASNVWHTLEIEAAANQFKFKLNGGEVMPPLENPNFRRGRIGYWTKSDSVSHFVDTRITYTPREIHAQRLVNSALTRFDRLLGLRVVVAGEAADTSRIIASSIPSEVNTPGIAEERLVIGTGEFMYLSGKEDVTVTLPLRDRNGEIIAAIRVSLERFRGQTQKNAIIRAQPVAAHFQSAILNREDLWE